MDSRKAELEKTLTEARMELDEIQDQERRHSNEKLIGKCFVFINSYGVSGPAPWPLYIKVQRMDKFGGLYGHKFQTDCDGQITINFDRSLSGTSFEKEITQDEFKLEWDNLLESMKNLGKANPTPEDGE